MTIFGHWQTWLLLAGVWFGLMIMTALAFCVIARVGKGGGRN